MPVCQNCSNKWSWKQTIKTTFTLDPALPCPYCGEKQFQTKKSRLKSSIFNVVIALPLLLNIFLDIPGAILLSLFPVLFVLIMLLYPFLLDVSSKEEYVNFFEKNN